MLGCHAFGQLPLLALSGSDRTGAPGSNLTVHAWAQSQGPRRPRCAGGMHGAPILPSIACVRFGQPGRLVHAGAAAYTRPSRDLDRAHGLPAAQAAAISTPVSTSAMEVLIDQPGPVEVQAIGADWEADLSGLLNTKGPEAMQARLKNRMEPIKIYGQVVRHPQRRRLLGRYGRVAALR